MFVLAFKFLYCSDVYCIVLSCLLLSYSILYWTVPSPRTPSANLPAWHNRAVQNRPWYENHGSQYPYTVGLMIFIGSRAKPLSKHAVSQDFSNHNSRICKKWETLCKRNSLHECQFEIRTQEDQKAEGHTRNFATWAFELIAFSASLFQFWMSCWVSSGLTKRLVIGRS